MKNNNHWLKKLLIATALFAPLNLLASACDIDDVFKAKSCYAKSLKKKGLPSDTPENKAPKSADNMTLKCLSETSKSCAKCSRKIVVASDYNMKKSEKGIREKCLTLW